MTPFGGKFMGCNSTSLAMSCIYDCSRNANAFLFCFFDGYGYTQEYSTLGKSLQGHKPLGPGSLFSALLERLLPLTTWEFCYMAKDFCKQPQSCSMLNYITSLNIQPSC